MYGFNDAADLRSSVISRKLTHFLFASFVSLRLLLLLLKTLHIYEEEKTNVGHKECQFKTRYNGHIQYQLFPKPN